MRARAALAVACAALAAACGEEAPAEEFALRLPQGFPRPAVPADNPLTAAKVELGRRLFYDTRLSRNRTQSCATCHQQARAFTDGRPVAVGSTGEAHRRNSLGLTNVAYASALTWANPLINTLERQALLPLLGESPVELGWAGAEQELFARLAQEGGYAARFAEAFPGAGGEISLRTLTQALAAFQRTLISGGSPVDRWGAGDTAALSESARRGLSLFNSERVECYHCHSGFNFSDSVMHAGTAIQELPFHNTGLYDLDGKGAFPPQDTGLFEISGRPEDMGRFRAPTLRNLRFTAPYMHDGSIATLSEVIDAYGAGGRSAAQHGRPSPLRSDLVPGFVLGPQEKADLLAFLDALNDEAFVTDPALASPFQ